MDDLHRRTARAQILLDLVGLDLAVPGVLSFAKIKPRDPSGYFKSLKNVFKNYFKRARVTGVFTDAIIIFRTTFDIAEVE